MSTALTIPNTFAAQTGPIPLAQLDGNYTAVASAVNSLLSANYFLDSSVSANTIVVTVPVPLVFAYTAGVMLQVKMALTTTSGTVNVNVNGLGNKQVTNADGSLLAVGQLVAGGIVILQYDGVGFQVQSRSNQPASFKSLVVGPPASGAALIVNTLSGFAALEAVSQDGLAFLNLMPNNGAGAYNLTLSMDSVGAKISVDASSRDLQLQTTSTTRLTISSGGLVSIATPASVASALTVNGIATAYTQSILAPNTGGQSFGLYIQAGTGTADTALGIVNAANTINLLSVIGSGDIRARGIELCRFKAATTTRASTTTLADDPDLIVSGVSAGTYRVRGYLVPQAPGGGGAQGFQYRLRIGGTGSGSSWRAENTIANNVQGGLVQQGDIRFVRQFATINTASVSDCVQFEGIVTTTTAGDIALQWAQNSSSANVTALQDRSWMTVEQLS